MKKYTHSHTNRSFEYPQCIFWRHRKLEAEFWVIVTIASQPTHPHKYGLNKALLRETNG